MTISPQDLNAEERAIVDQVAMKEFMEASSMRVALACYEGALPIIEARRALFTPESEEPAPVGKCPHCRAEVGMDHRTIVGAMEHFSCELESEKPAPAGTKYLACGCVRCTCEDERQCQGCGAKNCEDHRRDRVTPAPVAAGEMPEADLTFHINRLESMISRNVILGDVKESVFALIVWARAQPVAAVRMTEELEHVLRIAQARVDQYGVTGAGDDAIAAVRAQAAAQPGKMVKVREFLRWALSQTISDGKRPLALAALAELDAAEGR